MSAKTKHYKMSAESGHYKLSAVPISTQGAAVDQAVLIADMVAVLEDAVALIDEVSSRTEPPTCRRVRGKLVREETVSESDPQRP
jgi:hypothetical protein